MSSEAKTQTATLRKICDAVIFAAAMIAMTTIGTMILQLELSGKQKPNPDLLAIAAVDRSELQINEVSGAFKEIFGTDAKAVLARAAAYPDTESELDRVSLLCVQSGTEGELQAFSYSFGASMEFGHEMGHEAKMLPVSLDSEGYQPVRELCSSLTS